LLVEYARKWDFLGFAGGLAAMSEQRGKVPDGRWVKGVSSKQSLRKAASGILKARLQAVWHWLPLAAERSEEDVEYVHQLRVSSRRAVEAVRVFSGLIPDALCEDLRSTLRQVRSAAGEARNLDVLCDEFVRGADAAGDGVCAGIVEQIKRRRRVAQQPVVTVYEELAAAKFGDQIDALLDGIRSQGKAKGKRKFGSQAPRYLKPVLDKFLKASKADLSHDEVLHNLRIRTKKLRYTMEIVEVAFGRGFRRKLYPQIVALQDLLGAVNDHATAKTLFADWAAKSENAEERAFFEGVLLAETKAHADLRRTFHAVWKPRTFKTLQRQFRIYCD
jgi:CHAD domain-containing protein